MLKTHYFVFFLAKYLAETKNIITFANVKQKQIINI